MKLSEKILYCRKKAMLSQEALAERIGVSRQAISKWETGEATPEVTKLLQLAQTFGVTTDWLLSEDAPQPEPSPQPTLNNEEQKPQVEVTHTWVDDVPGMLGRLMRKYGWLFGVRLAVSGAGLLAFGIFVSIVSSVFFSGMDSFGFSDPWSDGSIFGGSVWYDEFGNVVDAVDGYSTNELNRMLGIQTSGGGYRAIESTGRTIFGLFSGFLMLSGAVMLIAGVILAIELKKLNRT